MRLIRLLQSAVIIILISSALNAQNGKCCLKGVVLDSETNQPIEKAVIQVEELNTYRTTKPDGSFSFEKINNAVLHLEVTHLGYKKNKLKLNLNKEDEKNVVIYLVPKSIEIAPVVVSGNRAETKFEELYEESNVVKGKDLQRNMRQTLASTLANEAGLAMRSMGPAPARPVIRGLGGTRVQMSEDGVKTTDLSATSPDHATTIEPFSVDRIEVMRGPKVLTQTPTTIGGVVNVVRREIPHKVFDDFQAMFGTYGETVNSGYLGSAVLEYPINPFSLRAEISRRHTSDVQTPAGELDNSYSRNLNYSLGSSFVNDFGFIGASFRNFQLDYGVPGGFVGAHPNGVDIEMKRQQFNAESQFNFTSPQLKNLNIKYSRVLYEHTEFEANGNIGSQFKIVNNMLSLDLDHEEISFLNSGTLGASFEYRDFEIGGFVFTPPSTSLNLAAYLYENFSLNRFSFEFGSRINYDRITPESEDEDAKIGHIREREFLTYSLSFSMLYEFSQEVYIGANISKSSRVPTIEELFSEGPHLAAYSYEIGNPELESESGIGTELFVYHNFDRLKFNLNLFRNDLSYYITPRNTGEINYATFLPVYKSFGVPAIFYGAEGKIDWEFVKDFNLSTTMSYTYGEFDETGDPLPQIPPLKGNIELTYTNSNFGAGVSSELAAAQNRTDQFEEETDGYVVFNSFIQYNFNTSSILHSFTLNFDNIFDTEYRNHLSRVKSILPEPGRNIRLIYKLFL